VAPRPLLLACPPNARGACLASGIWLAGALGAAACDAPPWQGAAMDGSLARAEAAQGPVAAWYEDPTTRYAHGALGDTVEAGTLAVQLAPDPDCRISRITLPQTEVFEDVAPRLADLNGDGRAEIIVVHSHRDRGARLAVYALAPGADVLRLAAATPHIGSPNRWLAPLGAADLDGDGVMEIAYVDRPHLARTLRIWRITFTAPDAAILAEVATAPGLTNHRLGDPRIPGGIRTCGDAPEMITANADWTRVVATTLSPAGVLTSRDIGPWQPGALDAALACPR
jgi:hypothetical protein